MIKPSKIIRTGLATVRLIGVRVGTFFSRSRSSGLIFWSGYSTKSIKSGFGNKYDLNSSLYTKIRKILEENPINRETQLKIEEFVQDQLLGYLSAESPPSFFGVNINIFNPEFKEYINKKTSELNVFIDKQKRKSKKDVLYLEDRKSEDLTYLDKVDLMTKEIFQSVDKIIIVSVVLYCLYTLITHHGIKQPDNEKEKINYISTTHQVRDMGNKLIDHYITIKFNSIHGEFNRKNPGERIKYVDFKENFLKDVDGGYNSILLSELFRFKLGGKLIDMMVGCGFVTVESSLGEKEYSVLKLCNEVIELVGDNINEVILVPYNLPMIVKPNPYTSNKLGGYLLNGDKIKNDLIIPKNSMSQKSTISEDNILYYVINQMMSTPFKINVELLDYITMNGERLGILCKSKHEFSDKKDRTTEEEGIFQRYISKKISESYILKIARTYANVPEIFLPILLDNRGRLYPQPAYLHYQGSELAKALILFARPDILTRTDYNAISNLKVYGATCFGNGLNKKSFQKKLEWVEENWMDIINFDSSDLVNQAEEKILFISFCMEMNRFNRFLNDLNTNEFKTYLPIQLDGSCNGFQHLALLSDETKLFENLNLGRSSKNDDPKDFYDHILTKTRLKLYTILDSEKTPTDERDSIKRILNFGLDRSNIKKALMTKPYNASNRTIIGSILDSLVKSHKETIPSPSGQRADDKIIWWYKKNETSKNYINYNDVTKLFNIIDDNLYIDYPRIKSLSLYLKEVAKVLNVLGLPIVWRLPTGLCVEQKYMKQYTKRIKPFAGIRKTLSIKLTDKIKIDKQKQATALMPNLVHSLDASTLALLYKSLCKSVNECYINFYSVHDCYAVTAKHVDDLFIHLKLIYIELYADEGYIYKFHNDFVNSIITHYGDDKCYYDPKKKKIIFSDPSNESINIPEPPIHINREVKDKAYIELNNSLSLIS